MTSVCASGSQAPKFNPIMVKAYNHMAENHRHELGPWAAMVKECRTRMEAVNTPTILDIATGPGEPAKSIALAMPNARIIATDVNEDMIKAATKQTEDLDNVECVVADVEDLSNFEDESIDCVTCCYGYMFPTDKVQALKETRRVLKTGGSLIATTWDRIDIVSINKDIMTLLLGYTPPPTPLNPMSLSEKGLFKQLLNEAGFDNISQTTSTYPVDFGDEKEFQFTIGTILLRDVLDELNEKSEQGDVWERAEKAFWDVIHNYAYEEEGRLILPHNTFRLTVAKK